MQKWTLPKVEHYLNDRIAELRRLAKLRDPWVFLCAASFIEYLAQLELNKETTQTDYKNFLKNVFFRECPEYSRFTYASGSQDLDVQMYHVLRCGVIHSFSLIASTMAKSKFGRDRSILLAHRGRRGCKHLSSYTNNRVRPNIDAAIFVAEDFVNDIEKVTKALFAAARKRTPAGRALRKNIVTRFADYPQIGTLVIFRQRRSK